MLATATLPVIGALGAIGIESVTAQVESQRETYQYRVDYGKLRRTLRLVIVIVSAETTAAMIALLM